jgi:hypothetical protein
MKNNPIDFPKSLLHEAINGQAYWNHCNKKYRPEQHDDSYDRVVSENDVWFMPTHRVREFLSNLNPFGPNISIVTSYSDDSIDDTIANCLPPCVRYIYGPNVVTLNNRCIPIPLGLGPPPPNGHGAPLAGDIMEVNTQEERTKLLYVNFRPYTYPQERWPLFQKFQNMQSESITVHTASENFNVFHNYLNSLINHKFCLCPRGNGIDTHRLWECLYTRTIPIVKYNEIHRNWKHLPILFVEDWEQVTESFLKNKYAEMINTNYDYSMLRSYFWGNKFSGVS